MLRAVGGTFEVAGGGAELVQRFGAVVKSDPIVEVAVGTPDAKGIGFGDAGDHGNFLIAMLRAWDAERWQEAMSGCGKVIP